MSKRRAYRATAVKNVSLEKVLESGPEGAVTVGMDVGKDEILVVLRWADASFERPWKVRNPLDIKRLVSILTELGRRRCLTVGMESTGTYGDALRQALTDAKLNVHRVGGKATHDYAEIFDGVPSQHDGKDAAIIAELVTFGKSCSGRSSPKGRTTRRWPTGWIGWMPSSESRCSGWVVWNRFWPDTGRRRPRC